MRTPIFFGRLDFSRLSRHVARLDSSEARSEFLLSLVEALMDNEAGKNTLADEILGEALGFRSETTERKRKERMSRVVTRCHALSQVVTGSHADITPCHAEYHTVPVPVPIQVNADNTKPPKSPKGEPRSKKSVSLSDDFLAFWAAYPNKVNKDGAVRAFEGSGASTVLQDVLRAVTLSKASENWQKDNGRFIPHPTTWLNQKRWESVFTLNNVEQQKEPKLKMFDGRGWSWEEQKAKEAAEAAK